MSFGVHPRHLTIALAKHAARTVEISPKEFGGLALCGFDGKHAFDGTHIIDVGSGQFTTVTRIDCIGMLNGIIYSTNETREAFDLVATPIQDAKASRVVHSVQKSLLKGNVSDLKLNFVSGLSVYFIGEKSAHAWDGKTFIDVTIDK